MTRFLTRRAPGTLFTTPSLGPAGDRLSRLMEDLYEESEEITWMPAVDVTDAEDEIVLAAELPGLTRDDVQIEVEDDVLRIHGEKSEQTEREEKDGKVRVSERRYGAFARSFALPATVQAEEIKAEMKNGVLTVRLPKTKAARGRRIEIEGE